MGAAATLRLVRGRGEPLASLVASFFINHCREWMTNLTDSSDCPRCLNMEESSIHVLRDCAFARDVWISLGKQPPFFHENDVAKWIKNNSNGDFREVSNYLCVLWHIWLARNAYIFDHYLMPLQKTISNGLALSKHACEALGLAHKDLPRDGLILVGWTPPQPGWVKLNVDGSLCHVTGNASAGGLVREHSSTWLKGFSANLGATTSFNAELWALLIGLRLCVQYDYLRVHIEMDSASIVGLFTNNSLHHGASSTLLMECRSLLTRLQAYTIRHVYREANKVADYLANNGHFISGTVVFTNPPSGVGSILLADVMGTRFPRL